MSKLSELVKNRRETMRLSQQAIADRAGVSRAYISKIELGALVGTPLAEVFPKLAAALELNEDELREAAGLPTFREATRTMIIPEGWTAVEIKRLENYRDFIEWERQRGG